jgi:glyoxylase-like metal-dependent hydrolase (beta-lactamase superfamily II)
MEDDFTYVIRKALRGHDLAPGEAAVHAGLAESDVMALLRGRFSETTARHLAPVLRLSAAALAGLPGYQPEPRTEPFFQRLDMPFGGDGQVNAWLVRGGGVTLLFDTGDSPRALALALDAAGSPAAAAVFLTHSHPDHTGGLAETRLRGFREHTLTAGESVALGELTLHAFDLAGHCDGALGYFLEGLPAPACVVGDALFAGSIGGCPDPRRYRTALANLREHVFTLPDETILLPGHGPATTVGEERRNNPFFAK